MIKIIVGGKPIQQPRGKYTNRGGKPWVYYDKKVYAQKELIKNVATRATSEMLTGALWAKMIFYVSPPKALESIYEEADPDTRPDLDNYVKLALDALNGVVYKDDSQIVMMCAQKKYSLAPRTEIYIEKYEREKHG